MEQLVYRVPEAAQKIGVSRATLYRLLTAGEIDSFTVGAARLVPAAALRKWVAEKCPEAEGQHASV